MLVDTNRIREIRMKQLSVGVIGFCVLFVWLTDCSSVQSKRSVASRIRSFVRGAARLQSGVTNVVLPGGRVYVRERTGSGTGYGWKYTLSDPKKLRLLGTDSFRSHYEEPRPGAPVADVWHFQALEEGVVELTYHYLRPWLGVRSAAVTNRYFLLIKK